MKQQILKRTTPLIVLDQTNESSQPNHSLVHSLVNQIIKISNTKLFSSKNR